MATATMPVSSFGYVVRLMTVTARHSPIRASLPSDVAGYYFTTFSFFSVFFSSPKIISLMDAPAGTMG